MIHQFIFLAAFAAVMAIFGLPIQFIVSSRLAHAMLVGFISGIITAIAVAVLTADYFGEVLIGWLLMPALLVATISASLIYMFRYLYPSEK